MKHWRLDGQLSESVISGLDLTPLQIMNMYTIIGRWRSKHNKQFVKLYVQRLDPSDITDFQI